MQGSKAVKSLIGAAIAALVLATGLPAASQSPSKAAVGMPHADGPFSAALVLVSETNLSEFRKPAEQGPRLIQLTKARPGDKVAVKLLFMGFALDEGFGNVTYDIRVLRPDGQIYGTRSRADHKGLLAFKGATLNPTNIFNNAATLVIGFEPTDPVGLYRVEVSLHDNIGDRHIPMTAEITLVPQEAGVPAK